MSLVGLRLAMASGEGGSSNAEEQALLWRMRSGLDTTTIVDEVVYDGATVAEYAFYKLRTRFLVLTRAGIFQTGACQYMPYLTSISAPRLYRLANAAFVGCSCLVNVNLPLAGSNAAYGLGDSTFQNCTSLEVITLPEMTIGGKDSFSGCTKLREVHLPKLSSAIGARMFQNCTSLQVIDIRSGTAMATCTSSSFTNVPKSCKVVVPDGLLEQYRADAQWTASGLMIMGKTAYEASL